jgi:excisionase family DNA binding protein
VDEDEVLTLPEIATLLGINPSTPRGWVNDGRLPAHKNESDRKWLIYRRDLDTLLKEQPLLGRPRIRTAVQKTTREDWSDVPEQATLDLASSTELTRGTR